jgi:hypothetical protein
LFLKQINCASVGKQIHFDNIKMHGMYVKKIAYTLILPDHYKRKMAFYPSSKPEGNHANPTRSHLIFIFRLKYFLESNNKELYKIPYDTKLEG